MAYIKLTREQWEKITIALRFYANDDHYWGDPLSLYVNYDQRTLRDAHRAHKNTPVLKDRGQLARNAIFVVPIEPEK